MKLAKKEVEEAELIVFDFDGTIVNSLDIFLESFQKSLLAYNKTCTIAEARNNLGACSFVEIRKNLLPKSYKVIKKMLKGLKEKQVIEAHNYFQKEILRRTNEIEAYPDSLKLIRNLCKRKKIALLTNSSRTYTEKILKKVGIKKCFKEIIYGNSGFKDKSKGLKYLMKKYNSKSQKTLYLGDAPLDAKWARIAKCKSIIVQRWYDKKEIRKEKPNYIINSFEKLL